MALAPRFARVAALDREFVDREVVFEAFRAELRRVGSGPRVLNLVGVGGIGKSRLLQELARRLGRNARSVILDLQVPVLRQQEDALAVLRTELGRQGADFDRFDIAYAVLWQRLHPQLPVDRSGLPFTEESELLTQIVSDASGVPVFGTAVGLTKLVERLTWSTRRRRRIRNNETLQRLDDLSVAELGDAVTFLFAEDLRESSVDKPFVVFIDAYEALVPTRQRWRRPATTDVWLRDLVGQLDRGLAIVASREPVGWQAHDPAWEACLSTLQVDGLPMPARLQLLSSSGVTDVGEQEAIAAASDGLPFYIHLAVDTRLQDQPAPAAPLVSAEEILQRFLTHVDSDDIRMLELLSLTRMFDYEVFHGLAKAFDLPGHRMAWESLAAYSFVYPVGPQWLGLHQVMAAALQHRLSEPVMREVHGRLRSLFDDRASGGGSAGGEAASMPAVLREAAYHGLHADQVSGVDLLDYGDRARVCGGAQAIEGMVTDLREYLDRSGAWAAGDLADTAVCLEAESAILVGNAAAAGVLVPDVPVQVDAVVPARLAVAAAHAKRIGGETSAALAGYSRVWEEHHSAARLSAGLWAADLHMCQGRFRTAEQLAIRLEADRPADQLEFAGDVARLRHLGFRFALDYDTARIHLDRAERLYAEAGSFIGKANAQTNRAELLALTDPAAAVDPARQAIEAQSEIGAAHESGKAYTALAIAQMSLGRLADAELSFRSACVELERAGYRSGRARAELFRVVLHVRRNDLRTAHKAALWAVQELEAVEVYPTLVMAAAALLERLGIEDEHVRAAGVRARASIDAVDSLDALETRLAAAVTNMLDRRP